MASLHFPNHEALRMALVSGLIPAAVARTPVTASIPAQGGLWLKFDSDLPGEAYASLQRLGAKAFGILAAKESRDYPCWPALLPLRPAARTSPADEVLFELPVDALPRFIAALERLANQPAQFAILDRSAVIRVSQPPEYLKMPGVLCYRSIARNAWCSDGFSTESLPAKLLDTDGLTLARPERDWRCLQDIRWHVTRKAHVLGTSAPISPNPSVDTIRLTIPLRLRPRPNGGATEDSFWIAEGGIQLLANYFHDWYERSLRRLEFAIARTSHSSERILIRPARNSKSAPILTAPFQAYSYFPGSRKFLVPSRSQWVPAPRVEFPDSLAGPEPGSMAWLEQNANGYSVCRTSTPQFRSLTDAFTYSSPPSTLFQSLEDPAQLFAFPGFVVASETKQAGESLAPPKLPAPPVERKTRSGSWLQRLGGHLFPSKKKTVRSVTFASQIPVEETRRVPEFPNEWAARRQQLEKTLAGMPASVADPIRAQAWRELAQLAHTMGHAKDAAYAWSSAIWFKSPAPAAWYESWYRAELDAAKIAGDPRGDLLSDRTPDVPIARVFAARLAMLAAEESHDPAADSWLKMYRAIHQYALELPIRSCWLARLAAAELSKGDTLGLACERDAIVARLAEGGMDADLDSPSFLRYQGKLGVERYHATTDWLRRTRDAAQRWLKSMTGGGRLQWSGLESDLPSTRAYADLLFACGMAKLGDRLKCREWMEAAETILNKAEGPGVEPLVHQHLLNQFRNVIRSRHRWEFEPARRRMNMPEFTQKVLSGYAVEKLQTHLSVFEQSFNADPFGYRGLQSLFSVGEDLPAKDVRKLLDEANQERTAKNLPPRILLALELADYAATAAETLTLLPLALELLPETLRCSSPQSDVHSQFTRRATRAVELAGRSATRHGLSDGFANLSASLRRSAAEGNRSAKEVLQASARRIFATCRSLELFDEISELLNTSTFSASSPLAEQLPRAIGWFALGEDDRGLRILNDARHKLFEGNPLTEKERGDTALAYALSLAHAPAAMVPGRLEELFQRLDRIPMTGAASRYYALRPLEIIDAAIAAVVTDDFALDPTARTWLAEDEFRIRLKITRDLERALEEEAP